MKGLKKIPKLKFKIRLRRSYYTSYFLIQIHLTVFAKKAK